MAAMRKPSYIIAVSISITKNQAINCLVPANADTLSGHHHTHEPQFFTYTLIMGPPE